MRKPLDKSRRICCYHHKMPTDRPDRSYHIRPVLGGQTLAAALRRLVSGLSWADARRLIVNRHVHVNGNLSLDEARRLKGGDVVKVFQHARAPVPTRQDVRVRHIDADLIVVEKPAGMTTLRHAEERDWDDQRKQRQSTLDEVLQEMLPGLMRAPGRGDESNGTARVERRGHPLKGHPLKGRSDHGRHRPLDRRQSRSAPGSAPRQVPDGNRSGHVPPGPLKAPKVRPVHRLDRDTSGLMVFALSPRAEQALVAGFKEHSIRRAYWAVVVGRVEARTIESYFVRDRGDGLRGSTPSTSLRAEPRGADDPDAKRAVTHVRPVEELRRGEDEFTVVECRLETGRTHQIRIHLSEIGHPLCGEKVYTRPKPGAEPIPDRSDAARQALHSAELEFVHPVTGQPMRFAAPLPKDLRGWLDHLRGRNP